METFFFEVANAEAAGVADATGVTWAGVADGETVGVGVGVGVAVGVGVEVGVGVGFGLQT